MLTHHARHAQEKLLNLKQQNVWQSFISTDGKITPKIIGEYEIIEGSPIQSPNIVRDTTLSLLNNDVTPPFQMFSKNYDWKGKEYTVTTFISATEISHLIIKVFATEALILILLLIAIIILNKISSGKLWAPFFTTMREMEHYDIAQKQNIELKPDTGTLEFDQLNQILTQLVTRARLAYINQKQFVENASHEMQTPLAIIQAKLELLINQSDVSEKMASFIADISLATSRMSDLNRTLLLLSKIENNQFPENEKIDIAVVVQRILAEYLEFEHTVKVMETYWEKDIMINANRTLVEILISNIIKNAIVHNDNRMELTIELSNGVLTVENTGHPLDRPASEMFQRFKKGNYKQKTMGLGLSLVEQICKLYQFGINYSYTDGRHSIKINFLSGIEPN
ncbi:Probable sensor histidine kinase TcrY [Sphingobacterium multivorum]|uniref:histidine kinase n=2 Tax=Sphingobacterium multivorum TaxID=28454 RepID=A0A2X2JK73_SPHMU|nr:MULTISPECIES: HAMP domain-containing sensor histidine kinase [Sphingobacterium]QRQ62307.1 HAMP domain-containing histidine kinase [Sphingobacterium multivorum]SPZ92546.1 Probable sensor histidine kinase TcrY [Sphingobacterium multivorum]